VVWAFCLSGNARVSLTAILPAKAPGQNVAIFKPSLLKSDRIVRFLNWIRKHSTFSFLYRLFAFVMNRIKEKMAQNSKSKALEIWNRLSKDRQNAILANVFCRKCKITTIRDYSVGRNGPDIILRGKCSKCNGPVARLVENPNI